MIIAVCGFRGSGKSLFGSIAKKMGFEVFEMSEPVLDLMGELGIETTNENVRTFATEFREKGGMDAVAKLILPKLKPALNSGIKIVIIGVRSIEELEVFRALNYTISVAIISSEQNRFERIMKRGKNSDPKKIEDFRWADKVEENWGLKKLIETCDVKLENNSSEKDFINKVKEFLKKYNYHAKKN